MCTLENVLVEIFPSILEHLEYRSITQLRRVSKTIHKACHHSFAARVIAQKKRLMRLRFEYLFLWRSLESHESQFGCDSVDLVDVQKNEAIFIARKYTLGDGWIATYPKRRRLVLNDEHSIEALFDALEAAAESSECDKFALRIRSRCQIIKTRDLQWTINDIDAAVNKIVSMKYFLKHRALPYEREIYRAVKKRRRSECGKFVISPYCAKSSFLKELDVFVPSNKENDVKRYSVDS